ncbi:MAG: glycogen-binding domain-containing protein [Candidatus Eisenbacteria bacterium]
MPILVTLIAAIVAALLPTAAHGGSSHGPGSVSVSVGHDSEVWANDGFGVLEPSAARFALLGAEGGVRWPESGSRKIRGSLFGSTFVTTYTNDGPSLDVGASAGGLLARAVGERQGWQLRTNAAFFRRDDAAIFDSDEGAIAASWVYRAPSLGLAATAEHAWVSYGARSLGTESSDHEEDRRLDLLGNVLLPIAGSSWVELGIGFRHLDSNDPAVRYDGPRVSMAAQHQFRTKAHPGKEERGLRATTSLRADAAWGRRVYRDYPVLDLTGAAPVDTGEERTDSYVRFGLTLSRDVTNRIGLEVETDGVHQASNVDALVFDLYRACVGVVVRLGEETARSEERAGGSSRSQELLRAILRRSNGTPNTPSVDNTGDDASHGEIGGAGDDAIGGAIGSASDDSGDQEWQPEVLDAGVHFRVDAPGASSVSVVGTFNRWDTEATPLTHVDGDGRWECVVPLTDGVYSYAFVIDGVWTTPLDAPRYESDGYGGRNGVLDLRGSR